jgi:hypothetical protein
MRGLFVRSIPQKSYDQFKRRSKRAGDPPGDGRLLSVAVETGNYQVNSVVSEYNA